MILDSRRFGEARSRPWSRMRQWAWWKLPATARAWLLTIELVAVMALATMPILTPINARQLLCLSVLTVLALGYAELARRIERIRSYLAVGGGAPRATPLTVWSFAAIVVAPAGWAVALLAVLYVQQFLHARLDRTGTPHRLLFSAAAAVVAQAAAGSLAALAAGDTTGVSSVIIYVSAAVAYTGLNLAVMLTGMWLAMGRPPLRPMLPDADALGYDIACLGLGFAVGVLLVHAPFAAPVLIGPVVYLQRSAMVKSLHQAARTDPKTGTLNAAAWHQHATAVLERCRRHGKSAAVFVLDIDQFSDVNTALGHLGADQVITRVADTLRDEVRIDDAIGRFGGDEFIVIVDDVDLDTARTVGERIRAAIAALPIDTIAISVSVGLAHTHPGQTARRTDATPSLDDLLTTADAALYDAKRAGRNQLCVRA